MSRRSRFACRHGAAALAAVFWPLLSAAGALATPPPMQHGPGFASAAGPPDPVTGDPVASAADTPDVPYDVHPWLSQIDGAQAMGWVRAENARSLGVLQADPHYQSFHDQALAIEQSHDRLPVPLQIRGEVYNFWRDARHVRGLLRVTTPASYATPHPSWTAVLDLDALSSAEHANWVYKALNCSEPAETRCLVSLSDGGEDATTEREFDLATRRFVAGGFVSPHSKQTLAWVDDDDVLIARDWGAGTMTASGYPFVVKLLHRGQALDQAREVYRATPGAVSVDPEQFADGQGHRVDIVVTGLDTFRYEYRLWTPDGLHLLDLPRQAELEGLLDDRLIVHLNQDWTPRGGAAIGAGAIIAVDLAHPDAPPSVVFAPGPRQSVETVGVTRSRVLAAIFDNVRGEAWTFAPGAGAGWVASRLALPGNVAVDIVSTSPRTDLAYLSVAGFITPTQLWSADAASGGVKLIRALPAQFDAAGLVVDQQEARSTDGTEIPYFIVHRADMKLDGHNPTLLYAYGGFAVSMLPRYSGVLGKLWLDHGGVYVLANIRGGGEFGPKWHDAGLKTHRQRIYDDFASVARDLGARGVADSDHLGIRGGSNGGLLMGVEFTQHPELWHAVIIEVPLLDMMNFETMSAGASWVGEYGSVSVPDERAFLRRISPLHNLKAGVWYPEPFIFTTTKDDRVGPVHARRFAARMQAMGLPFLYYEETEGGHAAGANQREVAQEEALEFTYLTMKLMAPAPK